MVNLKYLGNAVTNKNYTHKAVKKIFKQYKAVPHMS